jgi:hypothetical protein
MAVPTILPKVSFITFKIGITHDFNFESESGASNID